MFSWQTSGGFVFHSVQCTRADYYNHLIIILQSLSAVRTEFVNDLFINFRFSIGLCSGCFSCDSIDAGKRGLDGDMSLPAFYCVYKIKVTSPLYCNLIFFSSPQTATRFFYHVYKGLAIFQRPRRQCYTPFIRRGSLPCPQRDDYSSFSPLCHPPPRRTAIEYDNRSFY